MNESLDLASALEDVSDREDGEIFDSDDEVIDVLENISSSDDKEIVAQSFGDTAKRRRLESIYEDTCKKEQVNKNLQKSQIYEDISETESYKSYKKNRRKTRQRMNSRCNIRKPAVKNYHNSSTYNHRKSYTNSQVKEISNSELDERGTEIKKYRQKSSENRKNYPKRTVRSRNSMSSSDSETSDELRIKKKKLKEALAIDSTNKTDLKQRLMKMLNKDDRSIDNKLDNNIIIISEASSDDDTDLLRLRLLALKSKNLEKDSERNPLMNGSVESESNMNTKDNEIGKGKENIQPCSNDKILLEKELHFDNKIFSKESDYFGTNNIIDNDKNESEEVLQLRIQALKSAMIRKHLARKNKYVSDSCIKPANEISIENGEEIQDYLIPYSPTQPVCDFLHNENFIVRANDLNNYDSGSDDIHANSKMFVQSDLKNISVKSPNISEYPQTTKNDAAESVKINETKEKCDSIIPEQKNLENLDDDEDILRAMLLSKLSNKVTANSNTNKVEMKPSVSSFKLSNVQNKSSLTKIVKKTVTNTKVINKQIVCNKNIMAKSKEIKDTNLISKPKIPEIKVPKLIINLGLDSDTDDDELKNIDDTKIKDQTKEENNFKENHQKIIDKACNIENNNLSKNYEKSIDMFLKAARSKIEAKVMQEDDILKLTNSQQPSTIKKFKITHTPNPNQRQIKVLHTNSNRIGKSLRRNSLVKTDEGRNLINYNISKTLSSSSKLQSMPKNFKHMSIAKQREYRQLIHKMMFLEKQKLAAKKVFLDNRSNLRSVALERKTKILPLPNAANVASLSTKCLSDTNLIKNLQSKVDLLKKKSLVLKKNAVADKKISNIISNQKTNILKIPPTHNISKNIRTSKLSENNSTDMVASSISLPTSLSSTFEIESKNLNTTIKSNLNVRPYLDPENMNENLSISKTLIESDKTCGIINIENNLSTEENDLKIYSQIIQKYSGIIKACYVVLNSKSVTSYVSNLKKLDISGNSKDVGAKPTEKELSVSNKIESLKENIETDANNLKDTKSSNSEILRTEFKDFSTSSKLLLAPIDQFNSEAKFSNDQLTSSIKPTTNLNADCEAIVGLKCNTRLLKTPTETLKNCSFNDLNLEMSTKEYEMNSKTKFDLKLDSKSNNLDQTSSLEKSENINKYKNSLKYDDKTSHNNKHVGAIMFNSENENKILDKNFIKDKSGKNSSNKEEKTNNTVSSPINVIKHNLKDECKSLYNNCVKTNSKNINMNKNYLKLQELESNLSIKSTTNQKCLIVVNSNVKDGSESVDSNFFKATENRNEQISNIVKLNSRNTCNDQISLENLEKKRKNNIKSAADNVTKRCTVLVDSDFKKELKSVDKNSIKVDNTTQRSSGKSVKELHIQEKHLISKRMDFIKDIDTLLSIATKAQAEMEKEAKIKNEIIELQEKLRKAEEKLNAQRKFTNKVLDNFSKGKRKLSLRKKQCVALNKACVELGLKICSSYRLPIDGSELMRERVDQFTKKTSNFFKDIKVREAKGTVLINKNDKIVNDKEKSEQSDLRKMLLMKSLSKKHDLSKSDNVSLDKIHQVENKLTTVYDNAPKPILLKNKTASDIAVIDNQNANKKMAYSTIDNLDAISRKVEVKTNYKNICYEDVNNDKYIAKKSEEEPDEAIPVILTKQICAQNETINNSIKSIVKSNETELKEQKNICTKDQKLDKAQINKSDSSIAHNDADLETKNILESCMNDEDSYSSQDSRNTLESLQEVILENSHGSESLGNQDNSENNKGSSKPKLSFQISSFGKKYLPYYNYKSQSLEKTFSTQNSNWVDWYRGQDILQVHSQEICNEKLPENFITDNINNKQLNSYLDKNKELTMNKCMDEVGSVIKVPSDINPQNNEVTCEIADKYQIHSADTKIIKCTDMTDNITNNNKKIEFKINNRNASVKFKLAEYASPLDNNPNSSLFRNNLDPNAVLCPFELRGLCRDSKCQYKHLSN